MNGKRISEFLNNILFAAINFFIGSPDDSGKRRIIRYGMYFFIVLGANIMLGKDISNNRYAWYANVSSILLLNLNIILVLVLFIVLFRNIAKLIADRKEKVFGARLQTKLVIFSVVLVVVPVFSTYIVSTSFVKGSLDRWFDANVYNTIRSSLGLAQGYQDESLKNLSRQTEILAKNISENYNISIVRNERVRKATKDYIDKYVFNAVAVYSRNSFLYVQQNVEGEMFSFIDEKILNSVFNGISMSNFVKDEERPFFWGGIPIKKDGEVVGAIFTVKTVPPAMVANTNAILTMDGLMKQLRFYSTPVRTAFNVSNFLIALLVIFASIWGSIIFVRSITIPLKDLSAAAEDISKGKLDIQVEVTGNDEITLLSGSFNEMATKLKERTQELHRKNKDLAVALTQISKDKRYIDTIYSNVDSGIVLFDKDLKMLKVNAFARSLITESSHYFEDVLGLKDFLDSSEQEKMVQFNLEADGETKLFSAHVNKIFSSDGVLENIILVLDDNTHIMNLQRITLWKEVATRIAHEIKNPLTPIKLTAERVKKRSQEIQSPVVKELVEKSMQMIINESEDLLKLVDEFNQYARMPSQLNGEINLKHLVAEVIDLQGRTRADIKTTMDIPDDIFIHGDKYQIKRAFVNLLQNSMHAIEREGNIRISVAKDREDSVSVIIEDDGCGIKEEDLSKIFVPYFSKKPDGTGLGLAIVKKIIEEHGGSITVESKAGEFTRFHIHLT